jgi:hypothetical protein
MLAFGRMPKEELEKELRAIEDEVGDNPPVPIPFNDCDGDIVAVSNWSR